MPHQDFDLVRRAYEPKRDPVTFTLAGDTFTVVPDPMLGDLFDLADAPEPTPDTEQQSVQIIARFVRRLLPLDERNRWDQALYRVPSTHAPVIIAIGAYVAECVSARPIEPPVSSSGGRNGTGRRSRKRTVGTKT